MEPFGIFLDVGQPKNVNKNATADKAIRELRERLVRLSPHRGAVSEATLARAMAFLNSLIRHSCRSAKDFWLSRDQRSGDNIHLDDKAISSQHFANRNASHLPSSKYFSRNGNPVSVPSLKIGDTQVSDSDSDDEYFPTPLPLFATPLYEPVDDFHLLAAVAVDPLLDDLDDPEDYYLPFLDLYADPLSTPFPKLHIFQPLYGEPNYLAAGDIVAVVQQDCWCKVVLTSHSGVKDVFNNSLYWNYTALDYSNPVGGYLFPGQAWWVLRGELASIDLSDFEIVLTTIAVSVDDSDADTVDSDDSSVAQIEENVVVVDAVDSDVSYEPENEEDSVED